MALLRNLLLRQNDEQSATYSSSLSYEVSYASFSMSAFVVVLSSIDVVLAMFEHAIDKDSQFVGGGGDGLWRADARAHPVVIHAQSTVALEETLRTDA